MRHEAVSSHLAIGREMTVRGFGRCVPFVALLALTCGCSASDVDPVESSREAASTFANDKAAYDYFLGKGLTNFQAAAVVGNLDQESGVNPSISQAGGGVGRGIAQWSTGARWDTTKNDNVQAFAAEHGQSATSLALQFDFMWYELTTFPEYGLAALKASTTLEAATQVFEDEYEGCVYAKYPECALPARISYAKTVFKAYGADTGQGGAGGAGAGAGGASTGGSAGASGGSVAGSPSASGGNGGSSESAGSPSVAGSPSSAGSPSAAGSPNVSVAGAASVAGSPATTTTRDANDTSSCAVSPNGGPRSATRDAFGAACALLAGLSMFGRRRRQ